MYERGAIANLDALRYSFIRQNPDSQEEKPLMNPLEYEVLIIDDSTVVRRYIREMLIESLKNYPDMKITEAESGTHALNLITVNTAPDLIFLDVEMPGIDGFETCQKIKEISTQPYIVMLTSRVAGDDFKKGKEAGCDKYLLKPPNPSDVKSILRIVHLRKENIPPPGAGR